LFDTLWEAGQSSGIVAGGYRAIDSLRIEKGYPERVAFSRAFDLPEIQYWRIEKGRANISINSLVKLLYIHRMPIEEFFKDL
jgi:hypothetical protein